MSDLQIVAALRAREPQAMAALFDAYAEALFQYCWLLLRSREAARLAVRGALVAAATHPDRLRDPAQLRPWLYALARGECHRRRPMPPAEAGEPSTRPGQPDDDERAMAWDAVTIMPAQASEILDLTTRHDLSLADSALVLGVTEDEATAILSAAKEELRDSFGAQLIVRRTGSACSGLTDALGGWNGPMTQGARDRVLAHARGCEACGANLPRSVSPARVYDRLPTPRLGQGLREELAEWLSGLWLTDLWLTDLRHAVSAPQVTRPENRVTRIAAVARTWLPGRWLLGGMAAAGIAGAGAVLVLTGFPAPSARGPAGLESARGAPAATASGAPRSPLASAGAAPAVAREPGKRSAPVLAARIPGRSTARSGQARDVPASRPPGNPAAHLPSAPWQQPPPQPQLGEEMTQATWAPQATQWPSASDSPQPSSAPSSSPPSMPAMGSDPRGPWRDGSPGMPLPVGARSVRVWRMGDGLYRVEGFDHNDRDAIWTVSGP